MLRARSSSLLLVSALVLVGVLVAAPPGGAQNDPLGGLLTPPTKAPTTTARPTTSTTVAPADQAPDGAQDAGGDGVAPPSSGIVVPPEAQRIIASVKRTRPSDDEALVKGLEQLLALGASQEEAYQLGMGRFPVAGLARWSHDWLLPRYGPGFRFHLGCDVVAAHGTPVRAPVDGTFSSSTDSLGGLTARVTMPDGTRFAFAHLSGLAEGEEGRQVRTGDILGFVGDSGNARGGTAHVHVAVYPRGGPATDPKPILDRFVEEAVAGLPAVVAAYAAAHPEGGPIRVPLLPTPPDARLLRPALATGLLSGWTSGQGTWSPTQLFVMAADPALGAGYLLRSSLDELVASIDWAARSPRSSRATGAE
jgi:murein DD-endopeptidase MepM/ murein hydrolase activator NlpD